MAGHSAGNACRDGNKRQRPVAPQMSAALLIWRTKLSSNARITYCLNSGSSGTARLLASQPEASAFSLKAAQQQLRPPDRRSLQFVFALWICLWTLPFRGNLGGLRHSVASCPENPSPFALITVIKHIFSAVCICVLSTILDPGVRAGIIDFNHWTLVQDPPNVHFSATADSATQVTLSATGGAVPSATDIGFQSINGSTPAASTSGYAFDPAFDFSVAIDFALTFSAPEGGLGIGFGIGEDADGMNSAGAALLRTETLLGPILAFGGAARIDDVNQTPIPILVAGQTSGRFIASYEALTGTVVVGVSTDGNDSPEGTATFTGIQNNWDDGLLLFASFFLRSQSTPGPLGGPAWTSGTADAVFSDFRVISGSPVSLSATAVPEPSSLVLLALGGLGLIFRRRMHTRVVTSV